jgi:hypothetical protein
MIRIDLLDPTTGFVAGNQPIRTASRVRRTLGLDRIGKWAFDVSVADPAFENIEGSDFRVYWASGGDTHLLGECSYLDHGVQAQAGGAAVSVQASGRLRDLARQTVLQRSFDGATDTVNDVLSEIVPLRSGWSLGDVDTITTPAPMDFWYETVYDGVRLLAETFDYHFREGATSKTLDFGAFGDDSGLLLVGGSQFASVSGMRRTRSVARIEQIGVSYRGGDVVNRLIPFGGAVGVATIDLSETTSTQAGYPVQSAALPGGGSYYYLEDSGSISTYGLTERRFLRKDLRPISNSPAAREYAANILYEATLASLLRLKDRQITYDVSVADWQPGLVQPGDKVRLMFRGFAQARDSNGGLTWLDIDDESQPGQGKEFYILEISEEFGDGVRASLKLNENGVSEKTTENLLAETIRAFETAQIHVQPTISRYTQGPYVKRVSQADSVSADFTITLGPETLDIWYVKIQVVGEPLKSSVKSVVDDGGTTETSTDDGSVEQTTAGGGGINQTTLGGGGINKTTLDGGGINKTTLGGGSINKTTQGGQAHSHSLTLVDHVHAVNTSDHTHNVTIKNSLNTSLPTLRYDSSDSSFPIKKIGTAGAPDDAQTSSSDGGENLTSEDGGGTTETSSDESTHTHSVSVADHTHSVSVADHTHSVSVADHTHSVSVADHTHSVSIEAHSHSVTIPDHTHATQYGIFEDTQRPDSLTIRVNGSIVASGVTLDAGNDYTYELDITSDILAAATLQQDHTIRIEPGSGRGDVIFQAQILAVIQGITVS